MNILVTGGAGFIGSHLVDQLIALGNKVKILDNISSGNLLYINSKSELIQGSITDASCLKKAFNNIDLCYHLAAIPSVQKSMDNWPECHQVNFSGTIKIFLEAAKRNIPVISTSSAAVYGDPVILPLNESDPINSKSPYGTDKYCSELQAKVFGYIYNLKSVTLRLFNVYGSRQDPNSPYSGVISIFAKQMSSNQPITVYGDGNQERDFIHVNDVIKLLIKSQEHVSTDANVYNGCTGNGTSLNKLIEILSNILNIKAEVHYHPFRDGDIYKSIGNPQKAQNDMGFIAQTGIKAGLLSLFAT